jgi:hypothetical protein
MTAGIARDRASLLASEKQDLPFWATVRKVKGG